MCGNGVVICMEIIRHPHRLIPMVPHRALPTCFVVVVVAAVRGAAVWLIAATSLPKTATPASVSAWCVTYRFGHSHYF